MPAKKVTNQIIPRKAAVRHPVYTAAFSHY